MLSIKIIKDSITRAELQGMAREQFGDFVKAVVDVEQKIMAVGGEFHADGEVALMEQEGARRDHTWGINLYPAKTGDEFIEFDSMINIKPALGNRSRTVEDAEIRERIEEIVYATVRT